LEKVGFQSEGVLRQRRYWENHFYDVEMFSLLRKDYLLGA
jgi:RimJ/RimL family protein N-acetyltransferase